MPPIVIPYASSAPYDNSAYVTRMADLMLRRGDLQADALRRAGDARAQMWSNVGNVALSTLSQIGAARDAERQRAIQMKQQEIENAIKDREFGLREREMEEAAAARRDQAAWQRQTFRDGRSREMADNVAPGTVVSAEDYDQNYSGTQAAPRFRFDPAQPAQDAWRTEPLDDSMPEAGAAELAQPEHYTRVPNWSEQLQAEAARRQSDEQTYRRGRDVIEDGRNTERDTEQRRQFEVTNNRIERQFNATQSGAGAELLSDDGLDLAATSYRITGRMPAMGMGKDGDRKRIINRAAEQARILRQSPAAVMQRQATYKADAQALTRMTTGRAAAAAFEEKALQQADLVADLSNKVSRSDYPIINGALVKGQVLMGGTNAHLLNNALLTFTTEYAKIMSGATASAQGSTDAARREAGELISSALAKGTLTQTIAQMKREMAWTVEGYNSAIGRIEEGLGGGTADWSPGALPKSPQGGSGWFSDNAPQPGKKP